MLNLIELMILAAAIDGKIDVREQDAILRILSLNKQMPPFSNGQIAIIQDQLSERFKNGETREDVITQAAKSLDETNRHLAYAMTVEVVMADNHLARSESDYLREQRRLLELDQKKVEKIHFSAKLRYGIGGFD